MQRLVIDLAVGAFQAYSPFQRFDRVKSCVIRTETKMAKQIAKVAISRSPNDGGSTKFEMTPGGGANAGISFGLVMVLVSAACVAATGFDIREFKGRSPISERMVLL